MQSLRFALQPAVDNISVNWTVPEGVTVDMLSPPINALFQGQRALIYAQIKGQVDSLCMVCMDQQIEDKLINVEIVASHLV